MDTSLTGTESVIKRVTGNLTRLLFIIAGPSGVGKNTIIRKILANHQPLFDRIRTYTTRQKRDDEIPDEQYHFVSPEDFHALALAGRLLEVDENNVGHDVYGLGEVYSMPRNLFQDVRPECYLVIAEVDIHGMRLLKSYYEPAVSIFIAAEPRDLIERIMDRRDATMDAETLAQRMRTAHDQISAAREFDYVVFNQDEQLEKTVAEIETIMLAERMRVRSGFDLEALLPAEAYELSPQ
ncbi:MAG: hypothetical protein IT326_03935 [Anaerolineae bacterium]|nr:hypothetical protein [Anaerolineae bacterium]